jgi:hypothetical protein
MLSLYRQHQFPGEHGMEELTGTMVKSFLLSGGGMEWKS